VAKTRQLIVNPFRPGAGQKPVYLAGRTHEMEQFQKALNQEPITQNVILTGLRGVGKTVLLEDFKPVAQTSGWLWTGNDLSESISLTEERLARRIVVDLSALLGPLVVQSQTALPFGFARETEISQRPLSFDDLWKIYESTPGLIIDKLRAVLLHVWTLIKKADEVTGIVFAYDEAQNLSDHAMTNEYPLSLLIDLFSGLQRNPTYCQFILVLTGLPTLYPKLNAARTYTERMFHVMHLERLDDNEAREAIEKPIELTKSPLTFSKNAVAGILNMSAGYPYFLQFIGKEVFDAWISKVHRGEAAAVPSEEILEKLDQDFFAPRWARATDRQQDFMKVISTLPTAETEFSVQAIVTESKRLLAKSFTPSHAQQMLLALAEKGLIYRNRRGGYCFAVPLLARFINRQNWSPTSQRRRAP
jgi:hypothetical protein